MNPSELSLSGRLFTMRIIAGCLIFGSLAFLGVAVWLVQQEGKGMAEPAAGGLPIVTLVAVAFLGMQGAAALILPTVIQNGGVKRLANVAANKYVQPVDRAGVGGPVEDTNYLLNLKQTTMLIPMALLEGASFFGTIAYLLEARPLALGVSVAAMLGMLAFFPTQERLTAWLAEQRRVVEEIRRQRGS